MIFVVLLVSLSLFSNFASAENLYAMLLPPGYLDVTPTYQNPDGTLKLGPSMYDTNGDGIRDHNAPGTIIARSPSGSLVAVDVFGRVYNAAGDNAGSTTAPGQSYGKPINQLSFQVSKFVTNLPVQTRDGTNRKINPNPEGGIGYLPDIQLPLPITDMLDTDYFGEFEDRLAEAGRQAIEYQALSTNDCHTYYVAGSGAIPTGEGTCKYGLGSGCVYVDQDADQDLRSGAAKCFLSGLVDKEFFCEQISDEHECQKVKKCVYLHARGCVPVENVEEEECVDLDAHSGFYPGSYPDISTSVDNDCEKVARTIGTCVRDSSLDNCIVNVNKVAVGYANNPNQRAPSMFDYSWQISRENFCFDWFNDWMAEGNDECGDTDVAGQEQCEINIPITKTCANIGFTSGSLTCKNDCTYNLANCRNDLVPYEVPENPCTTCINSGNHYCSVPADGFQCSNQNACESCISSGQIWCDKPLNGQQCGTTIWSTSSYLYPPSLNDFGIYCQQLSGTAYSISGSCPSTIDDFDTACEQATTGTSGGIFNTIEECNSVWPVPVPPICGNGIIEDNEQCDGTNLNGKSCSSYATVSPFKSGSLTCRSDCAYDVSQCDAYEILPTTAGIGPVVENSKTLTMDTCAGIYKLTCGESGIISKTECAKGCSIATNGLGQWKADCLPVNLVQPDFCSNKVSKGYYCDSGNQVFCFNQKEVSRKECSFGCYEGRCGEWFWNTVGMTQCIWPTIDGTPNGVADGSYCEEYTGTVGLISRTGRIITCKDKLQTKEIRTFANTCKNNTESVKYSTDGTPERTYTVQERYGETRDLTMGAGDVAKSSDDNFCVGKITGKHCAWNNLVTCRGVESSYLEHCEYGCVENVDGQAVCANAPVVQPTTCNECVNTGKFWCDLGSGSFASQKCQSSSSYSTFKNNCEQTGGYAYDNVNDLCPANYPFVWKDSATGRVISNTVKGKNVNGEFLNLPANINIGYKIKKDISLWPDEIVKDSSFSSSSNYFAWVAGQKASDSSLSTGTYYTEYNVNGVTFNSQIQPSGVLVVTEDPKLFTTCSTCVSNNLFWCDSASYGTYLSNPCGYHSLFTDFSRFCRNGGGIPVNTVVGCSSSELSCGNSRQNTNEECDSSLATSGCNLPTEANACKCKAGFVDDAATSLCKSVCPDGTSWDIDLGKCTIPPSPSTCYYDVNGVVPSATNDPNIKCRSKWKLQYPATSPDVLDYWNDAKDNINPEPDCFENLGKTKPQQACCFLMEVPTTTGKDTYGQYADIKILDKNNNCLNC